MIVQLKNVSKQYKDANFKLENIFYYFFIILLNSST